MSSKLCPKIILEGTRLTFKLEYLFRQRLDFQSEMVFVHTRSDIHQDHNVVTEEALRAFRGITVLGFDVIRSSYGFFHIS